ncbi:hypothetical protein PORY_002138 [Pneumocystis oryctolagi]|uniref:Uncharacterized protein n=1 Tax=Pneumocystis oryctolagi TaxID=42067 RepID=A0ACB7CBV7_9ASCO|nr:hypothetical protein PORY_002138 [Pneumocystis oryctolagi]
MEIQDASIIKLQKTCPAIYISYEQALSVILSSITEFKNSSFTSLDLSSKVLRLINEFLDYILLRFLKTSQSIDISCLRNSISNELPTQLGIEAISEAEAELQIYLDSEFLTDKSSFKNSLGISWNLNDVWSKVRAKCMIYSTLSNQEKEDVSNVVWTDQLIPPSVIIYITSVLEFIAEHILIVSGDVCRQRLNETKNSFIIIEENDLNNVLEQDEAILSLWNNWKSINGFIDLEINTNFIDTISIISPKTLQEKAIECEKHFNTKTEFNKALCKINTDAENNMDIINIGIYYELTHKISTHELENQNYIIPHNEEIYLVDNILNVSFTSIDSDEKSPVYQKNILNKDFCDTKITKQKKSNKEKDFKTNSKIEDECKIDTNKTLQNLFSIEKKILCSSNYKEGNTENSSIVLEDNDKNILDTWISKRSLDEKSTKNNLSLEICPKFYISDSNIYETKCSFLETISITDYISKKSCIDPFDMNIYDEFSNIKLKNQSFLDEKLLNKIQKLSLINNNDGSVFDKEDKKINFFIRNYNVSHTNNYDFLSCKKSPNSIDNEISTGYKALNFEQEVYDSSIDYIDKDLEVMISTESQSINDSPSFNHKNSYFHSISPNLLSKKMSLKTLISPKEETKQNDFLIPKISELDNVEPNLSPQNTNKLNFNLFQDETKNGTFNKFVNSDTTMETLLNLESLNEIDFNSEEISLELSYQTDISNISNSYNKNFIDKYYDNTENKNAFAFNNDIKMLTPKEPSTFDSFNFSLHKDNCTKLEPREPTIPNKSTTDSLKKFLEETSFDEIHYNEPLNSKSEAKHTSLLKSPNFNDFEYLSSEKEFENNFQDKNDIDGFLKQYLKIYQKKESLIEFLKNSDPTECSMFKQNSNLFTNSIESRTSITSVKKRNKSLLKKIPSFKDSLFFSKNNVSQKNSHFDISSNCIGNSSPRNPYRTPESIKRTNSFLDDTSVNSCIFSSQDLSHKNMHFQNSINYINNSINDLNPNNSLKVTNNERMDLEHKESLTDFLKNTLNYIEEKSINDSYRFKKKKKLFFKWKRKDVKENKNAFFKMQYSPIELIS